MSNYIPTKRVAYLSSEDLPLARPVSTLYEPVDIAVIEGDDTHGTLADVIDGLVEGDTIVSGLSDILAAADDARIRAALSSAAERGVLAELIGNATVPCAPPVLALLDEADRISRLGTALGMRAARAGEGSPLISLSSLEINETPEVRHCWDRARLLRAIAGTVKR